MKSHRMRERACVCSVMLCERRQQQQRCERERRIQLWLHYVLSCLLSHHHARPSSSIQDSSQFQLRQAWREEALMGMNLSEAYSCAGKYSTTAMVQRYNVLFQRITNSMSLRIGAGSGLPSKRVSCLRLVQPISITSKATNNAVSFDLITGEDAVRDVLTALSTIIDPDFGTDIVSCGFIKDLETDLSTGQVSFRLELTTPACPVKDMFEQQAKENVAAIKWVTKVNVTVSAQPSRPLVADGVPIGLQRVSNIIAVSSCKGGVGKSTVAVNLAYSLAGMGAKVGIFDADIYGPSLPTMVNPDQRVLQMVAETKSILPTEYLGVKLVSFGFADQGSAIMRGPMVSGVINQLLTTTEWGDLDYLVVDFPPGTGDIQLTLCQIVPLTAAVIVTTPQKLAFIDVAKGVRMFSKLKVPCVAVVENMCYFDADGKRYYPFGKGSGHQVVQQFGISHLFELPIRPELSAAGDNGIPEVVQNPQGEAANAFSSLGVCVVQQCAKLRQQVATAVTYEPSIRAIRVKIPGTQEEFFLHPATVRRNDRSAQSIDEWTGEQRLRYSDIPENIEPQIIRPLGNYAATITWPDGFNQIAPFDQLQALERLVDVPESTNENIRPTTPILVSKENTSEGQTSEHSGLTAAASLLSHAKALKAAKAT